MLVGHSHLLILIEYLYHDRTNNCLHPIESLYNWWIFYQSIYYLGIVCVHLVSPKWLLVVTIAIRVPGIKYIFSCSVSWSKIRYKLYHIMTPQKGSVWLELDLSTVCVFVAPSTFRHSLNERHFLRDSYVSRIDTCSKHTYYGLLTIQEKENHVEIARRRWNRFYRGIRVILVQQYHHHCLWIVSQE